MRKKALQNGKVKKPKVMNATDEKIILKMILVAWHKIKNVGVVV